MATKLAVETEFVLGQEVWWPGHTTRFFLCDAVCHCEADLAALLTFFFPFRSRRVESILTRAAVTDSRDNILSPFQAPLQPNKAFKSPSLSLDAKTHGLLIISLTYLRRFAEANLRKRSPQRQGFISDLVDLEDAQLSKEDKLRVVERMWRSWGMMLGWRTLAFA